MTYFVLGFISGGLFGIIFMCVFQSIRKEDNE